MSTYLTLRLFDSLNGFKCVDHSTSKSKVWVQLTDVSNTDQHTFSLYTSKMTLFISQSFRNILLVILSITRII